MLRSMLLISLLLLAPLASISISEQNELPNENESNNSTSTHFQNAALMNTSAPLKTSLYFSNDIGAMDVQSTFDNRIIATWTQGVTTSSGYIDTSIRVLSFPSEGSPDGQALEYSDLILDRKISIPTNMSHFRYCQSNLLSDQAIIMVCSTNEVQNSGGPSVLRIDISGQSLIIPQDTAAVFVWNSTNQIQTMWFYDDSQSSQCNQGWFGAGTEIYSPMFLNDSFVVQLNCLSQSPTYLGNSTLICSNGYSKCGAIAKFDRNGSIENIVFMRRSYQGDYPCDSPNLDVNSYGYIEFQLSQGCVLKNSTGVTLYDVTNQRGEYVVFDSQLNFIRSWIRYPDGNSQGQGDIRIMDVETTHNQTYFTVGMGNTYQGFTSIDYEWLGQNISRYINSAQGHEQFISIVSKFNSNLTTRWAYSWTTNGQYYDLPEEIRATSDGIFWLGADGSPKLDWDNEVDYRTPPYPGPSVGNNKYSVVFSENGTWIDNPKWLFSHMAGYCESGNHNILRYTGFGISCLDYGNPQAVFELITYDTDDDGLGYLIDAFLNDNTQWYDQDLDGFGNNALGFQPDSCIIQFGNSTIDRFGCSDLDGDGMSDLTDAFVLDASQTTDSDNDGYGDNLTGFRGDACPNTYGESNRNGTYGCADNDFDGWADSEDVFPYDSSQWSDWDGDGFGDELIGYEGDACPSQYGNSTNDRYGCLDDDGDGWSNAGDDFINNPTQYSDIDGDGYGDNQSVGATMSDAFPNDGTQWNDTDGDGHGDNPFGNQGDKFPNDATKWQDSDDDGYADEDDVFVNDATQWNDTDGDGYGDEADGNRADAFPNDPLEWQDSDGDGYGNNADAFPVDGTQWNDTDGDGHGDNPYGTQGDWFPNDPNRWQDSDRDGYADEDDLFPNDNTQWNDNDGDGYGDNLNGNNGDAFPDDSTEWKDSDEDGVGNNADQYPYDPTQTVDSDGDGYGDNINGNRGDAFPQDDTEWSDIDNDGYGDNTDLFPSDGTQWNDTDGDGYGDNINGNRGDAFPQDDTEWSDIDNDGYGDNSDLFLTDGTQWNDTDGDGFGDNLNGANGDACLLIAGNSSIVLLGCVDSDGDGYADQIDAFISDALSWSDVDGDSIPDELDAYPNDATQSLDSDGDGFGDNPLGTNADKFPNDATQWNDIDGDGFGDNLDGNDPDLFITDGTQWADSDGDGYGDNPQGRLYDMFPDNPTQWLDEDGDGLGDNQSGTDADPFLNDFDNDGFNDAIDILPKLSSPGDLDADGCLDEVDAFPENPQECVDTDNDGVGDNADSDDDDDGWTDADEIRLGTDSLSSSDQPVDSFEIVIPGTAVGLGAWDLIGIFGGVPLFAWIAFGFATRTGRCDKYEELLKQATSRDELEQVALRWEYSLMLRMLGPHQGIRLERLRSELDDKFEFGENTEPEDIGVNQTSLVEREAKELPPIEAKSEPTPSKDTPATSTSDDGYEWLKTNDGIDWYRTAESGDEWAKFES